MDDSATGSRTDGAVEVGREGGGHRGGLATMRLRLVRSSLKIQVHHYDAGFHSFFGAAASATRMQNERGYAMSWSGRWRRLAWEISADHYAHLEPAQSRPVPAPTNIWRCSIGRRVAGEDWQLLLQQRRGSVWQSDREQAGAVTTAADQSRSRQ